MNNVEISNIAEQVQKAFFNIKFIIRNNEIKDSLKEVIQPLPQNPLFRLRRFPYGCCVDASHVLAEILSSINYLNIHTVTCIEASSEKDNHMWVECDGISIDITYGQDEQLYYDKVFITTNHPYICKPGYKIIRHEFIKTEFAQYIKETYIKFKF